MEAATIMANNGEGEADMTDYNYGYNAYNTPPTSDYADTADKIIDNVEKDYNYGYNAYNTPPTSDYADTADKIIDNVEKSNDVTGVTGKAGARPYENLLDTNAAEDPNDTRGAWLRGSLANYAESNYIISGVDGNYEKELENAPTMSVVSGKLPARTTAYTIIDEASPDVDFSGRVRRSLSHDGHEDNLNQDL